MTGWLGLEYRAATLTLLGLLAACAAPRAETSARSMDHDPASTAAIVQAGPMPLDPDVEQIAPTPLDSTITQLVGNSEVPDNATPEGDLERDGPSANRDIYRDVAMAWQAIRARGQQPTPELLAQSVGPENLAAFLSTFRNADRIFRPDIDAWPATPVEVPRVAPTNGGKMR